MTPFLLRHKEFIGNVAILMSGKGLAAAIAFLTMPIVARLFVPEDFGVAAMFVSACSIISSVSTLRYAGAVVLPKSDDEAAEIMSLALRVSVTVCLLVLLALLVLELSGLSPRAIQLITPWHWAVPVGTLLLSVVFIQESWLTRIKGFRIASASVVAGNSMTSGSRIAFGAAFGTSITGLIGGYLIGVCTKIGVHQIGGTGGLRAAFASISRDRAVTLARQYSDFPLYNAPAGLLFAIGQNLPVFLFGTMFSATVAGFYGMADRLARVPIGIVALSVRRVFLQRAADIMTRHGRLRSAYFLSSGGLALLGLIPFGTLFLFGEPILETVLGDRWATAGRYMEIMAPWLFTMWCTAPSHPILIVLREQRFWLILQGVFTVIRLLALYLAYRYGAGPETALSAFVAASALGDATTALVVARRAERHDRQI